MLYPHPLKTAISDILIVAATTAAFNFLLSSITYGLLLAMPSIGSLSTIASYFVTIGVIGLSCALLIFAIGLIYSSFDIANQYHKEDIDLLTSTLDWLLYITQASLVGAAILSVGFSIPLYMSISSGSPVITSTFLSLSAVNEAYLLGGIGFVSAFAPFIVIIYLAQIRLDKVFKPLPKRASHISEKPLGIKDGYNNVENNHNNSYITALNAQ